MVVTLSIDVTKIDKSKLKKFNRKDGSTGQSLDLVIFLKDEKDQFGNNGFVSEQVPKDSQVKGTILGNARIAGGQQQQVPVPSVPTAPVYETGGDIPF